MPEVRKDRATGLLNASILSGDLSLTLQSGHGARFPATASPDYFYAILEKSTLYAPTLSEIIKCTGLSGDVLTIARAQQGTSASAFASGDRVELRDTADSLLAARIRLIETTQFARFTPQRGFHGAGAGTDDPWGIFGGGGITSIASTLANTSQAAGQFRAHCNSSSAAGGVRANVADSVFRGNAAGVGGFHFEGKLCLNVNNATTRMFVGLTDLTASLLINSVNPSAAATVPASIFGIGFDDGVAGGNLRFYSGNGSTTTDTDTGITRANMLTNLVYWQIHAEPNAATIRIIVKDLVTGTGIDLAFSTTIPAATTGLTMQHSAKGNGGANTGQVAIVSSAGWPFARPFPQ